MPLNIYFIHKLSRILRIYGKTFLWHLSTKDISALDAWINQISGTICLHLIYIKALSNENSVFQAFSLAPRAHPRNSPFDDKCILPRVSLLFYFDWFNNFLFFPFKSREVSFWMKNYYFSSSRRRRGGESSWIWLTVFRGPKMRLARELIGEQKNFLRLRTTRTHKKNRRWQRVFFRFAEKNFLFSTSERKARWKSRKIPFSHFASVSPPSPHFNQHKKTPTRESLDDGFIWTRAGCSQHG